MTYKKVKETPFIVHCISFVGVVCLIFSVWYFSTGYWLVLNGKLVDAEVIHCNVSRTGDIDNDYYWYELTIRYDANEIKYQPFYVKSCYRNESIQVYYEPEHPKNMMLADTPYRLIPIVFSIFGALALAFAEWLKRIFKR